MHARLRYEVGRRRRRNRPESSPYRRQVVELLHEHLVTTGTTGEPFTFFAAEVDRLLAEPGALRRAAVYLSDAWELLQPDFRDRLEPYYAAQEPLIMLRMIEYASSEAFIDEHYLRPYELAAERLGRLDVLEVGSGIPHGLIRMQLQQPGVVASAALNDIESLQTRFALWFCERQGIDAEWIRATAGIPSTLPERRFNFVFAKDVFEHVHDPARLLDGICSATQDEAVLALDLDDKGARVHQHVSPDLAWLGERLKENGWSPVGRSGNASLFTR